VVKAASEPESGEFLVPLSRERVDAMRGVVEELETADLNEGFLSTVDAWMNKAHQVRERFVFAFPCEVATMDNHKIF